MFDFRVVSKNIHCVCDTVRSVVEIYFFSEGNHDRCEGKKTMWGKTLRKRVNSSFSVIYLQKSGVEAKGRDIVQSLETTYFFIGEETSDASIFFESQGTGC